MKRILIGFAVCIIAAQFLSSCRERGEQSGEQIGRQQDDRIRIGIAKIVQHEALDLCGQGIVDALRTRGIDAQFDLQNANGDMNTANQIANKFRSEKVTVAIGLGTPMALALANNIKDVPVIFSAITDPVGAKLVSSLDRGEGNVTGLSDALPTIEHITMFKEIANISSLGYIYTSSEPNSISALEQVEIACRQLNITLITQSINNSAEVRQATEAIINRVDGLYLTTDNTVHSAISAIIQVANNAKKPIFSGNVSNATDGGIMIAMGFNYYKAGLATGNMVADILLLGKKPSEIPVKFLTDPSETDFLIDLDIAKDHGITIPPHYISRANYIIENANLRQQN